MQYHIYYCANDDGRVAAIWHDETTPLCSKCAVAQIEQEMTITTKTEALAALHAGREQARAMLAAAPKQQIAAFWVDYFDRQIARWEGMR